MAMGKAFFLVWPTCVLRFRLDATKIRRHFEWVKLEFG